MLGSKEKLSQIWPHSLPNCEYSSSYYVYGMPWTRKDLYNKFFPSNSHKFNKGNHYWGPLSLEEILNERSRFQNLRISLKEKNRIISKIYKFLVKYRDRHITGFFIVKDNNYRFMVLTGKHRAYLYQDLDYKNVKVRIDTRFIPVIEYTKFYKNTLEHERFYNFGTTARIIEEIFIKSR